MAWSEVINFTNDTMNARSRDAFAVLYGWSATLPDGSANPETKAQFRARKIKEFMKDVVKSYEKQQALAAVADPTVQD